MTPLFAGRYQLLKRLGGGAQGMAVLVADTLRQDAHAVLKLGRSGMEWRDGTLAEFEALRMLTTPYTAPVLTLGFASPNDLAQVARLSKSPEELHIDQHARPFLVRAWVDGPSILEWAANQLKRHGHDALPQLYQILARLTEALNTLHRAGLIHGDLKADHVLIVEEEGETPRPVLIDFGMTSQGTEGTHGGTMGYLAPERMRGQPATVASDRFALGVLMAQTLVGWRMAVRCAGQKADLPEPLLQAGLAERVLQSIRRLLDAEPRRRPALSAVRAALLPPSKSVGGWQGAQPTQLPFLGADRQRDINALLSRAKKKHGNLPPVVLIVGERGSGRSRTLRQVGWGLQHAGRPTLEVLSGARPWARLRNLGPQLASLSGESYQDPKPKHVNGDRAHWLRDLAGALVKVLPQTPVALTWDDLGEDPREGLDAVEAMILALEQAKGRLRLWGTTTPGALPALRPLFASAGFKVVTLKALTRGDLNALLGAEHLGRQLSEGQLDRLYRLTQGVPAPLARRLLDDPDAPQTDTTEYSELEALIVALAGLVPGGATTSELLNACSEAGYDPHLIRSDVEQCIARGRVTLASPRSGAADQRVYIAPFIPLGELTGRIQKRLGEALRPLLISHPHLTPLAAALRRDEATLLKSWRLLSDDLKAEQARALVLTTLEAALQTTTDAELLNDFVETALEAGRTRAALQVIDRLLMRLKPTTRRLHANSRGPHSATQPNEPLTNPAALRAWNAHIRVAALRLNFALNKADDAKLADLPLSDMDPIDLTHVDNVRSQLDLRRSHHSQARATAVAGLERLRNHNTPRARTLRGQLWVTAAAAEAMQGGDAQHNDLKGHFGSLESIDGSPMTQARYQAMRAVAAYMRGDLDEATESYRAALDIVEKEGLDAERPLYLLNLGTAYERLGRLSMARRYYEQGSRCCLPTTRSTTRALLLANRANIDIKLGRAQEARELLAAAGRIAQETGLTYVTQFVEQLSADANASEGMLLEAEKVYARCANTFRRVGDKRHACELALKAGLAAARSNLVDIARQHLAAADADIEEFADLKPRASILRAEIVMARDGFERLAGVDRYLRALEMALDAHDDLTVLTEARWLLQRLEQSPDGPDPLALGELASITGRAWRRIALTLTQGLRQDMAKHLKLDRILAPANPQERAVAQALTAVAPTTSPRQELHSQRSQSASLTPPTVVTRVTPQLGYGPTSARPALHRSASPQRPPQEPASDELAERFYRMLSLNRRIIGETDLERLIPAALDIAIALSGAERGFLLLREHDEAPFEVAFSRDVDGRPISQDALHISETIARQVVQEGRAIITEDAQQDQRFGQALSVHHLQLTSILCVPIRDREKIMGCLYMDHRDAPGAFEGQTPRMMSAYADQVAIALVSARHVAELRQERDELARARHQIDQLLADKEELLMDLETRCKRLEADLARERSATGLRFDYDHIVARAPAMRRVLSQVDRVIDTLLPVVIQGESGTGKEVIARTIHFNGPRNAHPFVPVNCGALHESLLESELFGHRRGAFTGATSDRKGLFEAANGGTLFLDEVGEMSLAMQVKVLRALQERRVRPVGAIEEIAVDVRIIAATNRDLNAMVRAGDFREDLYYRLATLVVRLPPLRDRRADIPLLVRHIMEEATQQTDRSAPQVSGKAVSMLMQHHWPGNIRQLENVIRAAMVLSDTDITPEILAGLLPQQSRPMDQGLTPPPPPPTTSRGLTPGRPPKCTPEEVINAMQRYNNNRSRAAKHLGVSLRTLQRYLKKYELFHE